ncbi:MAG: Bug family tripartite tricarboxylate transporter substrate binding protein [Burkholderiales bacterium]
MRVSGAVRKGLLCAAIAAQVAIIASSGATAQSYPVKPLRYVIDTSPGGVTDILGRLSAENLSLQSGKPVVVENRSGGLGFVALEHFMKVPNDGYTLMVVSSGALVLQPLMQRNVPYDPAADFLPVFNIAETPHILVVPGTLAVNNVAEFVAYVRANPGKINYGSSGVGGPPHLAIDKFSRITGAKMTHIPYKGTAGTLSDLVAGRIQIVSMSLGSARANLKSGSLRAIATGAKRRLAGLPDVPTAAEAGLPDWEMSAWFGIVAPKGTPADIVRYLNSRQQTWLDEDKTRARFVDLGAEPVGGTPESFVERLRADIRLWSQLVKDSGVKIE